MIFLGDSLEVMSRMEPGSVDLVLADLPYGTTGNRWDTRIPYEHLWDAYYRVAKKEAAIVLTATQPFTSFLVCSNYKAFKHEWIWHKSKSGSAFAAKFRPMAKHESVLVFCRGKMTYNPQMTEGEPYVRTRRPPPINNHKLGLGKSGENTTVNNGTRYPDSVIYFQQKWRRQDQVHPTQKPVDLMRYLVRTYSNENDLVLDNTMGSGTTGVAAKMEGRRFVGIDHSPEYVEIARKRIEEAA